jgi:CubicO group peptidase (beta-lactamase class C family)
VARQGRIAHLEAQGLMDIEARKPMQKDAIFRIMSMTKPVVGVSIMMMIEEGKIRLTDPVSKFIPEMKGLKSRSRRRPRVRRLPTRPRASIPCPPSEKSPFATC